MRFGAQYLPTYVPDLDSVAPEQFVDEIEVPTFLAGAWQDEQTGGYWPAMIDDFSPDVPLKVTMVNGGHSEPYLYVSPWTKERARGDFWNDDSFGGASLTYGRLLSASDPVRAAVDFFATGVESLAGSR